MAKIAPIVKKVVNESRDDHSSDYYDKEGNWDPIWKVGSEYEVLVSRIEWDTDGVSKKTLGLPNNLTLIVDIEENADETDVEDYVSEYLSDKYGYCHYGFIMKVLSIDTYDYRADEDNFGVVE